jgi:hypothetical protein
VTEETAVLGQNLSPVPFCPPQKPSCVGPGSNPGQRNDKPATKRLACATAPSIKEVGLQLNIWEEH